MYPTFLYNRTHPNGKIFTDEGEYKKAKKEGWVSSPAIIGQSTVIVEVEKSENGYPAKRKSKKPEPKLRGKAK